MARGTLTDADIARWRLASQHLTAPFATTATDVVRDLLAVQAENPGQSAWAVASRTGDPAANDVTELLDTGAVVRTHVLRSTWHYVLAEDIRWLLELTAPRVRRIYDQQLRETIGLDDAEVERAGSVVLDSLAARSDQTRAELGPTLTAAGFEATGYVLMILLAHLESRSLVCSGRPRDGEHTYALMSERVPQARRLDHEEALAELALRYFSHHGPATERDLAYWATITVTDVRRGLRQVAGGLASFDHDGKTFWHRTGDPPDLVRQDPRAHLLQILDEVYRGYQDSRWVLDTAGLVPRAREAAIGMALVDGQFAAWMKRTVTPRHVTFALTQLRDLRRDELDELEAAAERYGAFLGLPARLRFA